MTVWIADTLHEPLDAVRVTRTGPAAGKSPVSTVCPEAITPPIHAQVQLQPPELGLIEPARSIRWGCSAVDLSVAVKATVGQAGVGEGAAIGVGRGVAVGLGVGSGAGLRVGDALGRADGIGVGLVVGTAAPAGRAWVGLGIGVEAASAGDAAGADPAETRARPFTIGVRGDGLGLGDTLLTTAGVATAPSTPPAGRNGPPMTSPSADTARSAAATTIGARRSLGPRFGAGPPPNATPPLTVPANEAPQPGQAAAAPSQHLSQA